ncbi:hypothetical protein EDD85DRAFT_795893 [Armillaria nabsnona]|nr:hypothetical protein EDD85DRAFT_795893 [Armillaria nabsnona]
MHTRYHQVIQDMQCKLSSSLSNYHAAHDAMIRLDAINEDDQNFWRIDAKDICQKNTFIKQSVGDSYHSDGKLWWLKMVDLSQSDADDVITQENKRKKKHSRTTKAPHNKKDDSDAGTLEEESEDDEGDSWVWSWKGKRGTWCEADINMWALEANRVQYCCVEADMDRWQEQWKC